MLSVTATASWRFLREATLLDLTLYGVSNAVWREARLLRRISVGDALELLQAVLRVSERMRFVGAGSLIHLGWRASSA